MAGPAGWWLVASNQKCRDGGDNTAINVYLYIIYIYVIIYVYVYMCIYI